MKGKHFLATAVAMMSMVLVGCTKPAPKPEPEPEPHGDTKPLVDVDSFDRTYVKVDSDQVYVRKVENLTDQNYILGMDASSVIAEEASGVKYYDFNGNETDVFKVLSDSGVNYIRVRVWNDPFDADGHGYGGGNCDINTALAIGRRATANNMSLLVDFHYSDFWADPAKQQAPKAWANMNITEKVNAIYEYTKTSLQTLKDAGVVVGMVQIGNETNGGKMAGEITFAKVAQLMNSASRAIREVCPEALVALHFANPEKPQNMLDAANRLKNVDYDVWGSSYYPYWHGTLENLSDVLSTIATTYDKYVMVLETSYAWTLQDFDFGGNTIGEGSKLGGYPYSLHGQINSVTNILDTIVNKTTNGIGICYWEGTWIAVGTTSWEENMATWRDYGSGWAAEYAASYDETGDAKATGGCVVENQAFFDSTGHPLESLKVFNLVRFGNIIENKVDGAENIEIIHYDTDTFTLPATVKAIYYDDSRLDIPVTWEPFDVEAAKARGNGTYEIKGLANGFSVICTLKILEYNYFDNYSFETGNHKGWTLNTTDVIGPAHKIQVTDENPRTGKYAFHFWTTDDDGVSFELVQEFSNLKAGKYKIQMSLLGGGNGSQAIPSRVQNVYIFFKVGDTIIAQQSHKIGCWDDGYKDVLLKGIEYNGSGKVTVGIHLEAHDANVWGDIDDAMLNIDRD